MTFVPYGVVPPIVTPMTPTGEVKHDVLADLSRHLVKNGVHGLFPLGTTGEFYAIDDVEYKKILITVRDAVEGLTTAKGRRIHLYAGCNHITTRGVIKQVRMVEEVGGYDAVSVLTPMFVSQTQDEVYQYYKTIADATDLPLIIYNNLPKTNVTVLPATVRRLAEACPNIVGVKDSTGDMTNTGEYIRLTQDLRENFQVIVGRDTLIFAGLMYGATGAIASCANVAPRIVADIYDKWEAGDLEGALEAQFKLAPLRIATGMGSFPQTIKEALTMQGFDVGKCLDPIQELPQAQKDSLRSLLEELKLI